MVEENFSETNKIYLNKFVHPLIIAFNASFVALERIVE